MTATENASTACPTSSERQALWRRVRLGEDDRLVVSPRPSGAFSGEILLCDCCPVTVAQVTTPAMHGSPWQVAVHEPDHVFIHLQEAGSSDVSQDGRQVHLEAGSLTLVEGARPYTIALDGPTRMLVLKLPADRLASRLGDPSRLVGVCADGRDAALLGGFLRSLVSVVGAAGEPGWSNAVSDVLFDLVALSYRRAAAAPGRPAGGERWKRTVREFVDRHLEDPELGAPMIARGLGVTPRYVQMVFAGMATTASAYIVGRRLERAAQILQGGGEQVADVAFRVGFADLSYFYRSFRKRYGVSPGRYASR